MKMLSTIVVGLVLVLVMAACGDSGEGRVLHLQGFDITESAYRSALHSGLAGQPGIIYCQMIQDQTPEEIMDIDTTEKQTTLTSLMGTPDPTPAPESLPPGATPVPGQMGNLDDLLWAGKMIKEECARILP